MDVSQPSSSIPREDTESYCMSRRLASDEVVDEIAAIEMHRQGTEQESGLAVACSESLRKLHVLLEQEKEALRVHGPETVHAFNVEAVANEITRVQSMTGGKSHGQGAMPRSARPRGQQPPRPEKTHNAPRNRGRRTIGRSGGRGGGRGGGGRGGGGEAGGGGGANGGNA
jgi:uncharacterized membrane protein YgcG